MSNSTFNQACWIRFLQVALLAIATNCAYGGSPPTAPVKVTPSGYVKLWGQQGAIFEWSDTGVCGFSNRVSHFYRHYDVEVTSHSGSEVWTYDPLGSGSYSITPENPVFTPGQAYMPIPTWATVQSDTYLTYNNGTQTGNATLSMPFFGADFKKWVESHIPDYHGGYQTTLSSAYIEYIPVASYNTEYDPEIYGISNLEYYWTIPSNLNTTVIWDQRFTPKDYLYNSFQPTGPVQHNVMTWQSNGASQSPTYTIEPLKLNNGSNGTYNVVQIPFELLSDLNNDGQIDGSDAILKVAAAATGASSDAIEAGTEYLFVNDQLSNGLWDAEDKSITKPPSYITSDDDVKRLKTACGADFGMVWFTYEGGPIANLAFYTGPTCSSANQITFPYALSPTHGLPATLYVRAEGQWSGQIEGKLAMNWGTDGTTALATDKIVFTVVHGFGDTKFFNAARDYILENNTRFWTGYKVYGTSPNQQTVRFVVMREEATTMQALDTFWRPQPLWGIDAVVGSFPSASVAINGNFTFDIQNVGWFKDMTRRCQGRLVSGGVLNTNVSSDNDDPNVPSPTSPLHGSEYAGVQGKYIAMTSNYNFQMAMGRVPVAPMPQEAMGGFSTNYGRGNQDQMIGIGKLNTGKRMVFTATVTYGTGVTNSVAADAQTSGVPALPGGNAGDLMLILGDANTSIALAYKDPTDKLTVVNKGDKHTFVAQLVGKYCINTYLLFYCNKPR